METVVVAGARGCGRPFANKRANISDLSCEYVELFGWLSHGGTVGNCLSLCMRPWRSSSKADSIADGHV